MSRLWNVILCITLLFMTLCINEPDTPIIDSTYPGMNHIMSRNSMFQQGSLDLWAESDEKPPLTVRFSYNFWIDTSEVTIKDFWSLTGYLPSQYSKSDTNKITPVCFVTWYDAVLFCNERSKKSGLDTIYSYTSVERTPDGKVFHISGLASNLTKLGYRLPTEAEWEYSAKEGLNTIFPWGDRPDSITAEMYAWYERNSGDSTHKVCSLLPNAYGLYDMFGNAMEWVNDNKCIYQSGTYQNFAGGFVSDFEERAVKGGGFLHSIEKLRRASRSDVYSTTAATSTRYIGFRCNLGAIPSPQFLIPNGTSGNINPVFLSVSSIEHLTGTRNSRIVFVNRVDNMRYLCYVDFLESKPRVYQFFDIDQVYCPTISPDGKWVAFCTQNEGLRDGSDIYIRKLDRTGSELTMLNDKPGFVPRWWVDPVTFDTLLVYTNSAVLNSNTDWKFSVTKTQKISGGKPVGSPMILQPEGSFHGGLSKDKQFLATGYQFLKMMNLKTNELRTLFTAPQNGKQSGDTSQVCNVSITPDPALTDRVLFLDFGSGRNASTITKSAYGFHEIIFMSNFEGNVLHWYQCPEGYKEWDHPEWSNNRRYAVASAIPLSEQDNRKDLFLLNLDNSTSTKIISGTDLWHPSLWTSQDTTSIAPLLSTDSTGFYNEPASHYYQSELARKFPDFWKFKDSIEILFLGSSYMQNGAAPSVFKPFFGYNMGFAAGGLLSIKKLLNNYALNHCKKLKVVVISLNIGWYNVENGDYAWNSGFENTKGYNYDKKNEFWRNGLPPGFNNAVKAAPNPYDPITASERGWYPAASGGWGNNPPEFVDSWIWNLNDNYYVNFKALADIVTDLESRNILLVGVLFPNSPYYKNTPIYGSSGPSWKTSREIISQIQSLDSSFEYFSLYDAYNYGDNDYVNEDFENAAHLSKSGGLKISARIDSIVDTFLSKHP